MQESAQQKTPLSTCRQPKHHKPRDAHPRTVQSDNDAFEAVLQDGSQSPSRSARKGGTRKKPSAGHKLNGVHSDVGEGMQPSHHTRHNTTSAHSRATPIKNTQNQAYAGGAFTNSPAPSALPIPPFFSRSVPKDLDLATEALTATQVEDPAGNGSVTTEPKRQTTPLDWMFDLARKKDTTLTSTRSPLLSPPRDTSASRSPANRDNGAEFPFELDGVNESNKNLGTPFTQRLSAAATPRSTSLGGKPMTEQERKAKTDALKMQLLGDSNNLGTLGATPSDNNPFNARNPTPRQPYTPPNTSNPSTPYQNGHLNGPSNQYLPPVLPSPTRNNYYNYSNNSNNNNNGNGRPQSSGLRNIYNPTPAPPSPPPTLSQDRHMSQAIQSPPRTTNFAAIYGTAPRPSSSENKQASTDDGLESLKKMLNMSVLG